MNKSKHFVAYCNKKGWFISLLAAVVLSIIGTFAGTYHASAAADLQGGCYDGVNAQDGNTAGATLKSPFGSTPNVCLGMDANGNYWFQLAVTIPDSAVSANPSVTAKDSKGNAIPMVQDTRNTLFVSSVPIHVGADSVGMACDTSLNLSVTVAMTGRETQSFTKTACPNGTVSGSAHDTWVRTIEADGIGSGGSSGKRWFKGYIGLNFGTPYNSNDPETQWHVMQKVGISSVTITGGNCASVTDKCNLTQLSNTLDLTDGVLTITANDLTPVPAGVYAISIRYNARSVDNNMNLDEWTDHTLTFKDVKLAATGETLLTPSGYSEGAANLAYYDKDGNVAKKVIATVSPGNDSGGGCKIGFGAGFFLCPVINVLSNIADGAMGILNKSFEVQSNKLFDTSSSNQAYVAWQQIRNYANIVFVIGFLIIIFSQITSIGVTNYGIKKLLPKLIATAVLVNVSFPICALLVDLSNLLGYGLATFLGSAITVSSGTETDPNSIGTAFSNLAGGLLATAVFTGFVYFQLAAVVGVVITAVVIGVTMVVLLGVRQALIILLVVLAPLAFAAMLLPNTNSLFKKWRKMLQSMLLVFPIASLLYGGGVLANHVLLATTDNVIIQAVASGLPVISLVAIYKVFTSAMSGLEGLGGAIGNLSNGIGKGGKALRSASDKNLQNSRYGKWRDFKDKQFERNRQLAQSGVYTGTNPLRKLQTKFNKSRNANGSEFGQRLAAAGISATDKIADENVTNEISRMKSEWRTGGVDEATGAQTALADALQKGDVVRARAAQKVLLTKGGYGLKLTRQTMDQHGHLTNDAVRAAKSELAEAGIKGKDAGLNMFAISGAGAKLSDSDSNPATHGALTDGEFSTQSLASLEAAKGNGSLGAETAARILRNDNLANNLTKETRALLEGLAGTVAAGQGQAAPAGAAPQSQAPSGQASQPAQPQTTAHGGTTYEQTESGLFIPRN